MMRNYTYQILWCVLILWGCSNNKANRSQLSSDSLNEDTTHHSANYNEPIYDISFNKNMSYGDTDDQILNIRSHKAILADRKNRVYIPDYKTNKIHAYDKTGKEIATMGGKGRGPGEYLIMRAYQITPDYLYVYGTKLKKITAYSLKSLSYSHSVILRKEGWEDIKNLQKRTPGRFFYVTGKGRILIGFNYITHFDPDQLDSKSYIKHNTVQFYWLNQDGDVGSNMVIEQHREKQVVVDFFGSEATTSFHFFAEPLQAVSKKGVIAAARSNKFNITLYQPNGEQKGSIKYPFKRAALNREKLIKQGKRNNTASPSTIKAYKTMDLPDKRPALERMFFDGQNRLWVAAIVPNLEVYKWFVFNLDGQLLARFSWSRDKSIQEVKNDCMYALNKDSLGANIIERYKISMAKK